MPGLQHGLVVGDRGFLLLRLAQFQRAAAAGRRRRSASVTLGPTIVLQRTRLEQIADVQRVEADGAVQLHGRIESRDRDADLGGRRMQLRPPPRECRGAGAPVRKARRAGPRGGTDAHLVRAPSRARNAPGGWSSSKPSALMYSDSCCCKLRNLRADGFDLGRGVLDVERRSARRCCCRSCTTLEDVAIDLADCRWRCRSASARREAAYSRAPIPPDSTPVHRGADRRPGRPGHRRLRPGGGHGPRGRAPMRRRSRCCSR